MRLLRSRSLVELRRQTGAEAAAQLDVTTLPKGVYVPTLEATRQVRTRRFVQEYAGQGPPHE
ncbi:hypothetical protein EJV47_17060 [Hymenobacter gummosus]|uniref:Uncharacterized protein n=1 Tax=Hymenobacter gummosus TaxID=1776032 RepID=A0A431U0I7_9BACT|nr:hypothetical protein [Hymenobacter gummosus]RTQ48143.1 hypothetical protein EJV47_17060 [Hymenobacter gummosus]